MKKIKKIFKIKITKSHFFVLTFLFLVGILISATQFIRLSRANPDAPIPGHPWSEIECDTHLCVDTANNRIGIGTVSPSNSQLQLSGSGDVKGATVRLTSTGSTPGDFFLGASDANWTIGGNKFFIGVGTPSSANVKFVIDSTGSVGIGNTAPQNAQLCVGDGTIDSAVAIGTTESGSATLLFTHDFSSGLGAIKYENSNDSMDFYTSGNRNVTINTNGNVGIGTASPSQKLHLVSSGTLTSVIENTSSAAGYAKLSTKGDSREYQLGVGSSGEVALSVANKFFIYDATGTAVRLAIDTNGDVGIGTASPTSVTSSADLQLTGTIKQDDWTAPSFLNSWVNYGGSYNTAGYFRDKNGIVHLRGMIKLGSVGSAAFTLPEGYRPTNNELLATISNGAIGRINIDSSGNVTPASPSNNAWVSLDGITFRASGY